MWHANVPGQTPGVEYVYALDVPYDADEITRAPLVGKLHAQAMRTHNAEPMSLPVTYEWRITKRQAEAAFAAVLEQYKVPLTLGAPKPELVRNWDYLDSGPTAWAIRWEDGPDEWAYHTSQKEIFPAGVFVEPVTYWALGLYPA